jgi:hypothetical protein
MVMAKSILLVAVAWMVAQVVGQADEKPRPNILFVLVDDQSPFDLKVYNPRSELQTPTLDKLAAEGMVFDGAYHMGSFIRSRLHAISAHDHVGANGVASADITASQGGRALPGRSRATHDPGDLQSSRL